MSSSSKQSAEQSIPDVWGKFRNQRIESRECQPGFPGKSSPFLGERQTGKSGNFTVFRPEAVSGYAIGNPMNLTMVIGVYASISKESGLP
jgi:hypothetical protein